MNKENNEMAVLFVGAVSITAFLWGYVSGYRDRIYREDKEIREGDDD